MVSLGVCPEPNGNERRQAFAGKTANFVMLLDKSGSTTTQSLAYKHPFVWAVRDTLTWGQLGVKAFMILSQKPKIDPKIFGSP